jgi:hypothetical protein
MKWGSLENKIKSALYGHQSEVDVDALWSAIEPGVDAINRRKKRKGLIWFWILGAALAGLGGYYYQRTHINQGQPQSQVGSFAQVENLNAEAQATRLEAKQDKAQVSTTDIGSPTPERQEIPADNPFPQHPTRKPEFFTKKQLDSPIALAGKEKETSAVTPRTADDSSPITIHPSATQPDDAGLPQPGLEEKLPQRPLSLFDLPQADVAVLNSIGHETVPPPFHRHNTWGAAMYLQGSISFVERGLSVKDTYSYDLLKSRQKTERELEAYQVGLGFTLQHRSGLNFSTGLNYTQINEQFRFNDMVVKVDTVYDIKYLVVNLNDDTVAVYGEVPIETKTTYQKEYYNRYRMFDLPFLVGYRHEGHEFSVGAQAGVFVNLSLATKGQFLKTPTEAADIDRAGIFKSNIGWSYYFGLTAGYMVNDNLEFYASPFFRHYPKDFTKDGYMLRQRYNLYGLNVGVRYGF